MLFVSAYINEINDMLFAAYAYGRDPHNPYGCEGEMWAAEAINNFLTHTGLNQTYEYAQIDRKPYCKVPQIIEKPVDPSKNVYGWS